MSRNATARRMIATSPPIAGYLADYDRACKGAGVPRPERRRRIRSLTHGTLTVMLANALLAPPIDRMLVLTGGDAT